MQPVNQAIKKNTPELRLQGGSSAKQPAQADCLATPEYKALHGSVCFMCLVSRGAFGNTHDRKLDTTDDHIQVDHNGKAVTISRTLHLKQILRNRSLRELKQCPPSCIGPSQEDLGIETTDELGVFQLMETQLPYGAGALIDVRPPEQHATETIPGSLNLPYTAFYAPPNSAELATTLAQLGVTPCYRDDYTTRTSDRLTSATSARKAPEWEFFNAKGLVVWCYGPLGGLSTLAIASLLELGYPANKIRYYRGGLQLWKAFGLTTVVAERA